MSGLFNTGSQLAQAFQQQASNASNTLGGVYGPQQVIDPAAMAKLQAFLATMNQAKAEEEKKAKENAFLKTVQDAIDKRRIFRKRVAAITGAAIGIPLAPIVGFLVYVLTTRLGIAEPISNIEAAIFGGGIAVVSIIGLIGAVDSEYYDKW